MLPLSRLTSLLFSPQQIKCLHFHTRIHFWNKLNLKCNKTKCFKMIEVKVVAGALGSVGWVWICTLRTAGVEGVTGAASVVFGRLMLQVPDPAHRHASLSSEENVLCCSFFDPRGRDAVFWITQLCRRNWSGFFPTFADSFAFFVLSPSWTRLSTHHVSCQDQTARYFCHHVRLMP